MNELGQIIGEAAKGFTPEISMASVMLAAAIAPETEIPEYVAFGNAIESICDAGIQVVGFVAACLLARKLWIGNKTKQWELMNQKKKSQEEGLKGSIDELIQTIKNNNK
jgi:hypothetical protein